VQPIARAALVANAAAKLNSTLFLIIKNYNTFELNLSRIVNKPSTLRKKIGLSEFGDPKIKLTIYYDQMMQVVKYIIIIN